MSVADLVIRLIDKLLEPHGVDYNYVIDNPVIGGGLWCMYYTTTPEQEAEFKKWAVPLIQKELKCSKEKAEKEYQWFNLAYGLKLKEA